MVEEKKKFTENNPKDNIYLHHKNKHFIHNPFLGFKLKKLNKSKDGKQILKTNSDGLRCEELLQVKETDTMLLGGSVAFSSFASNEDNTISSQLELNINKKVLNCGIGGHTLKQHFSLYFNYLKNIKKKNIIILFGFNDLVNCYLGKQYDEILIEQFSKQIQDNYSSPVTSSLKTIFMEFLKKIKVKDIIYDLLKVKNQNKIYDKTNIDLINKYIRNIEKDFIFFNEYCEKFNINLIISLQPSIYFSQKKLSYYEQKNLDIYLRKYPTRYKFIKIFHELLCKNLHAFKNYHNLDNIFDNFDETIFLDEVHLSDKGNSIISNYFIKYLN